MKLNNLPNELFTLIAEKCSNVELLNFSLSCIKAYDPWYLQKRKATTPPPDIITLVRRHFKDNQNFDFEKHIETACEEDCMEYFNIEKFLPGSKLLIKEDRHHICYHGRECTAYATKLYKYKDYFIKHTFSGDGGDLYALSICHNYGYNQNFIKKTIQITRKPIIKLSALDKIIELHIKLYPDDGLKRYTEYVQTEYVQTEYKQKEGKIKTSGKF